MVSGFPSAGAVSCEVGRLERLRQPNQHAGRRRPAQHRVLAAVGGVLHRLVVRLAVAAPVPAALVRLRRGPLPLLDHLRVGRVEVADLALVGRAVERDAADLVGVAVPAGGAVRPVLGRAGRVVQLPAVHAEVAVLGGHRVPERLHRGLVGREALRLEAGRAQQQVAERVVRDQRRHLPARDELADVLRLGLRERARPVVGLVGEVPARAGAAPERSVVAVRVDARRGDDPPPARRSSAESLSGSRQFLRLYSSGWATMFAVSLSSPGFGVPRPSPPPCASPASREMLKPSGFTIGITIARTPCTSRRVRASPFL